MPWDTGLANRCASRFQWRRRCVAGEVVIRSLVDKGIGAVFANPLRNAEPRSASSGLIQNGIVPMAYFRSTRQLVAFAGSLQVRRYLSTRLLCHLAQWTLYMTTIVPSERCRRLPPVRYAIATRDLSESNIAEKHPVLLKPSTAVRAALVLHGDQH